MKKTSERGAALVMVALSTIVLVPMIGLAIDGGSLYLIRARLSQAADAAALAGARALVNGSDTASQTANATAAANKYFQANFPSAYWGTSGGTLNIAVNNTAGTHVRSVTVTAGVNSPLYFMSLLQTAPAHIQVTASAQRRDVNVILVLDHSGSMANAMSALQTSAEAFVNMFASGRDNVGLVVFGGNYYVDYAPSTNFLTDSPNVPALIGQLQAGGGTNTSQALWKGYGQLQALNQPGALNVVVLFTDGLANTFTGSFQSPLLNAGSGCSNLNSTITGVLYGDPTQGMYGLSNPVGQSATDADTHPASNSSGCLWQYAPVWTVGNGLSSLPSADIYGNSTNGTGTISAYAPVSLTQVTGLNVQNAGLNALDDAANRIRSDASLTPLIYCIGLGGNPGAPPDQVLMARVANDPSSPSFNSKQPAGLFVFAPSTAQLQGAFQQIASEILRLAQ